MYAIHASLIDQDIEPEWRRIWNDSTTVHQHGKAETSSVNHLWFWSTIASISDRLDYSNLQIGAYVSCLWSILWEQTF